MINKIVYIRKTKDAESPIMVDTVAPNIAIQIYEIEYTSAILKFCADAYKRSKCANYFSPTD